MAGSGSTTPADPAVRVAGFDSGPGAPGVAGTPFSGSDPGDGVAGFDSSSPPEPAVSVGGIASSPGNSRPATGSLPVADPGDGVADFALSRRMYLLTVSRS